jgi:hypothetical protein
MVQDIAMRFERNSLRRVQLVKQELPTLPEHMSSQPVGFCCVFVVLCVVLCGPLLSCRPFLLTIVLPVL